MQPLQHGFPKWIKVRLCKYLQYQASDIYFTLELIIEGSKVFPGSTVSVKWMGVWYDGTVMEFGPKCNLFKVQMNGRLRVHMLYATS
jgi:hypothetical protein